PYITDTIRRLSKSLADLTIPWQIIIADNGSTDQTKQTIQELIRTWSYVHGPGYSLSNQDHVPRTMDQSVGSVPRTQDQLVYLECPKVGKGSAIRFAAEQTPDDASSSPPQADPPRNTKFEIRNSNQNQFFGFIDADLSADPDAIVGMVTRLLEDKADIVIASRLLITKTTNRSWLRTLSSKLFNFLADLFLNLKVADAQCGLKIMNERGLKILRECQEDGWFLDIEFLAKARQDRLRIAEVPVPWLEFRYPNRKSQIHHFRDGIEAIKAILRIYKDFRT
ncbi:MAG: glycosyltransferase, partial [Patescibacteria group bacterium]|nr:glycosyltransferase [Patescibacteria group bacterium]